jgi:hypothetical protein
MAWVGEGEYIKDEYATKDLYFAAFLLVKGMGIKKMEQHGANRYGSNPVYFIFNDKNRCGWLEEVFWNGGTEESLVDIKGYVTAVRDLKNRAFSISRAISTKEETLSKGLKNKSKYDIM